MIGRVVAQFQRHHGAPFVITHDPRTYAPSGLHRCYLDGNEIGRLLSHRNADDCERMLRPEPPRKVPPLPKSHSAKTVQR